MTDMLTLIVEDGTLPEGANCYAGLAEADAWLVPRGLWPPTPVLVDAETGEEKPDAVMVAAKTAALLRGADWLNVLPGGRWKGKPVEEGRVMAWPRLTAPGVVSGVVPAGVKIANMEIAALFYGGSNPLAPVEHGGAVRSLSDSESETVGPLTESASRSVTYAADAPAETLYPAVAGLLAPYLDVVPGRRGGGRCLNLERG